MKYSICYALSETLPDSSRRKDFKECFKSVVHICYFYFEVDEIEPDPSAFHLVCLDVII